MDRDWLERELAAGRSIESIAAEVGRDPSTVSYWVRKYGLASVHAARHAPRGGLDREALQRLVDAGGTTRSIAEELGVSQSTVRHWLRRVGEFVRYSPTDSFRCRRCRYDAVTRRPRKVKEILVAEAGGVCALCGYGRFAGALQFHHRAPADKVFGIALNGSARSLARAREEAAKCVLLCANCHAEVEWGLATIPARLGPPG